MVLLKKLAAKGNDEMEVGFLLFTLFFAPNNCTIPCMVNSFKRMSPWLCAGEMINIFLDDSYEGSLRKCLMRRARGVRVDSYGLFTIV